MSSLTLTKSPAATTMADLIAAARQGDTEMIVGAVQIVSILGTTDRESRAASAAMCEILSERYPETAAAMDAWAEDLDEFAPTYEEALLVAVMAARINRGEIEFCACTEPPAVEVTAAAYASAAATFCGDCGGRDYVPSFPSM